jgi:hypothetical protein
VTKNQWKLKIYRAIRKILEQDLDGLGADYLFINYDTEDSISPSEEKKMRKAHQEIMETFNKLLIGSPNNASS